MVSFIHGGWQSRGWSSRPLWASHNACHCF
jgi:hypothetical protein